MLCAEGWVAGDSAWANACGTKSWARTMVRRNSAQSIMQPSKVIWMRMTSVVHIDGRLRARPQNGAQADWTYNVGDGGIMRRRAFSLIELLVVIGIIGLLIGILLPALARARREAKKVACKAQLANIAAAFQMYINENDGWYPPATYWPEFSTGLPPVNEFLQKYISGVNK